MKPWQGYLIAFGCALAFLAGMLWFMSALKHALT